MTLLNTTLQIVRGVFKAPGDAFSAENDLFILELQDPAGFSLQVDGWSPNLPSLKEGGVWASSSIADGRTPLAQSVGNVTETMRLTMSNGDLQQRFAIFKKLQLMRQSVIDFWDGTAQIDPVYIRWHAAIGKGEQYALIYNLEMAQDTDIFNPEQAWDVTITCERESYWRGLPPGANPKEWTLGVVRGLVRGSALFDSDNMDLTTDSDHLMFETINNKFEWSPAVSGDQSSFITKNYIEISDTAIPGDAPALLELMLSGTPANPIDPIYIALSSKELSKIGHHGETEYIAYNFNLGDAELVRGAADFTKQTGTNTTGVLSNNSSVNYTFSRFPTTGVDNAYAVWGTTNSLIRIDRNLLRGSFMCFVRGQQMTAGTVGDTTVQLRFAEAEQGLAGPAIASNFDLPTVNLPIATTAADRPLTYLGRVTLPFANRLESEAAGRGRMVRDDTFSALTIKLSIHNLVAAARTIELVDLILIPIDEWAIECVIGSGMITGANPNQFSAIDNTGYFAHGAPELVGRTALLAAKSMGNVELRGSSCYLLPGRTQRLYFLFTETGNKGLLAQTLTVRANVIPRWAGIRDV